MSRPREPAASSGCPAGFALGQEQTRDPNACGYRTFMLVDASTTGIVLADWDTGRGFGCDLDAISDCLAGDPETA